MPKKSNYYSRFYQVGDAELLIHFKREGTSYQVPHHCDTGEVYDSLKVKFDVVVGFSLNLSKI